jgi:hypothetical protein
MLVAPVWQARRTQQPSNACILYCCLSLSPSAPALLLCPALRLPAAAAFLMLRMCARPLWVYGRRSTTVAARLAPTNT